jgi:hypothetical protein
MSSWIDLLSSIIKIRRLLGETVSLMLSLLMFSLMSK